MGSFPSKIPISLGILYGKSMGSLLTMRGLPPENPTALNLYHYIHWKVEDMMRLVNTPTNERFRYYTWCLYDMPMIQSEILGIFLKHINCSRISTSYISWSSNCSGALAVSFRDHISPPARLSRWFSKLPQVGYVTFLTRWVLGRERFGPGGYPKIPSFDRELWSTPSRFWSAHLRAKGIYETTNLDELLELRMNSWNRSFFENHRGRQYNRNRQRVPGRGWIKGWCWWLGGKLGCFLLVENERWKDR